MTAISQFGLDNNTEIVLSRGGQDATVLQRLSIQTYGIVVEYADGDDTVRELIPWAGVHSLKHTV